MQIIYGILALLIPPLLWIAAWRCGEANSQDEADWGRQAFKRD